MKKQKVKKKMETSTKAISGIIVFFIALFILVIGFDYVPAGSAGVLDYFGEVNPNPWGPAMGTSGIKWTGIFTHTEVFDCRTQRVDYEASAASQDLQDVKTKIAVNFKINPQNTPEIYKTIGINYQEVVIFPVVQEAVKSSTAKYRAESLIKERTKVKADITEYIVNKLQERGIYVTEVSITDFSFSVEFNKAIESKQVAEQKALEAENKLKEMEYNAKAMELQKQVVEIKKLDIQKEWITKWDGHLPNMLITSSDTVDMLLNLPTPEEIKNE